ncbi:nucleotide exchange factor GrpE [Rhodovulum sp. 12E13]|uniref:nucleotide exchange factor GrpE n=1 Tax=Rhodovulum sp. 12E13 TaxID=2203891 RepID=UPI000E16F1D2|nr:nucleotide exchange factor GrpE [Rhodovulum sp. 12E13]RDC73775.1 nucleotide exchange factor GrpE [Rhodovulum sp. 12E13]
MGEPKKDDVDLSAQDRWDATGAEPVDTADQAESATGEGAAAPGSEAMIAELTAERDAYKDRFLRALADAENARKRSDRDRREAENYGGSRLARDLLPVWDNLNRALAAATDEQRQADAALIEGVELTLRELGKVFEKHGIHMIRPELGEPFDPQLHEAMFEAPVPETRAGDIIQVMADGFLLHDRLLRPAQVGVSSTPG